MGTRRTGCEAVILPGRGCATACIVTCPAVCLQQRCICNVVGRHQAQAPDVVQVADLQEARLDQPLGSFA